MQGNGKVLKPFCEKIGKKPTPQSTKGLCSILYKMAWL